MNNFAMWYFLIGFVTVLIGGFRNWRGKQAVDPDELTVLSWFLCPFIYLTFLAYKYICIWIKLLKNKK